MIGLFFLLNKCGRDAYRAWMFTWESTQSDIREMTIYGSILYFSIISSFGYRCKLCFRLFWILLTFVSLAIVAILFRPFWLFRPISPFYTGFKCYRMFNFYVTIFDFPIFRLVVYSEYLNYFYFTIFDSFSFKNLRMNPRGSH